MAPAGLEGPGMGGEGNQALWGNGFILLALVLSGLPPHRPQVSGFISSPSLRLAFCFSGPSLHNSGDL